jgi:hypothetical protein
VDNATTVRLLDEPPFAARAEEAADPLPESAQAERACRGDVLLTRDRLRLRDGCYVYWCDGLERDGGHVSTSRARVEKRAHQMASRTVPTRTR